MIRREILTTAAVAATCFTIGQLRPTPPLPTPTTPTEMSESGSRSPEPTAAAAELEPAEIVALAWPEPQPEHPTLMIARRCDIVWEATYTTRRISGSQTEVAVASKGMGIGEEPDNVFVVDHHEGWSFALHPVSPTSMWAVAHEAKSTAYVIKRLDGSGATTCELHNLDGGGFGEVRATTDADGIQVYRRNDRVWSVDAYDNSCRIVASRATQASPPIEAFDLQLPHVEPFEPDFLLGVE